MSRKPLAYHNLRRAADATIATLALSVPNDAMEVDSAFLVASCDRLVAAGGAPLLVSDLRILLREYEQIARDEASLRARDEWMGRRGHQEGGK